MIRFQCQHCGVILTVREDRAGAIGRCLRCKQAITIPPLPQPEPEPPTEDDELTLITPDTPKDKALLNLPDQEELRDLEEERQRQEQQLMTKLGVRPQPEHTGQRRFPWPLDILLYPVSGPGLTVLGILTGLPLLALIIQRFVPVLRFGSIFFLAGSIILGLYALWYLAECVYDSACGGTRAPDYAMVGLGDMWSRVSYLLAVYITYTFPVVLCRIVISGFELTGFKYQIIFAALAAWALVFSPIGLLAMVVNDSISVLNPLFLLGSIFRAFFQYVGLLLGSAVLGAVFWLSNRATGESDALRPIWIDALGMAITNYWALVIAHVLGRFYWRNRERLDWGL